MAERVTLVQCINPKHQDSTPSMAVYDHGQDKLQVFCFGCHFYGWVEPSMISVPSVIPNRPFIGNPMPIQGDMWDLSTVRTALTKFFTDRNIPEDKIPWQYVTYGNKIDKNRWRPAFWYDLFDYDNNKIWEQIRFLDDLHPKIKLENVCGVYPTHAWFKQHVAGPSIRIVESWVDAVYLTECTAGLETLILLGTNVDKIDWYAFKRIFKDNCVFIYFDGDEAGVTASRILAQKLTSIGTRVYNHTCAGVKVYNLNG